MLGYVGSQKDIIFVLANKSLSILIRFHYRKQYVDEKTAPNRTQIYHTGILTHVACVCVRVKMLEAEVQLAE
jgi:hypothetical protein